MPKITEYTLVYFSHEIVFIEAINKRLNEGWELYGESFVHTTRDWGNTYSQAMVKRAVTVTNK